MSRRCAHTHYHTTRYVSSYSLHASPATHCIGVLILQRLAVVASAFAHAPTQREGHAEMFNSTIKGQMAALEQEPSFSIYDLECAKTDVGELLCPSRIAAASSSLKQVRICGHIHSIRVCADACVA